MKTYPSVSMVDGWEGNLYFPTTPGVLVNHPFPPARRQIRSQVLAWLSTVIREELEFNYSPRDTVVMPIVGPFQGGKSAGVEGTLKYYSQDLAAFGEDTPPEDMYTVRVLQFYTDRPPREDERVEKEIYEMHRHIHVRTRDIRRWIKNDYARPAHKKKIFMAFRISYYWYVVFRRDWQQLFTPNVDPKTGQRLKKLIIFPALLELAAVCKMVFPDITHTLAICPVWYIQGQHLDPRPGVSRPIHDWRIQHNNLTQPLLIHGVIEPYNHVGLYDSLYTPWDFRHARYKDVNFEEYREHYLGYDIYTIVQAIFRARTGQMDWAAVLNPRVSERFSDFQQHQAELHEFQRDCRKLADQRAHHQTRIPERCDLVEPIRQLCLDEYEMIYPGYRRMPTNL